MQLAFLLSALSLRSGHEDSNSTSVIHHDWGICVVYGCGICLYHSVFIYFDKWLGFCNCLLLNNVAINAFVYVSLCTHVSVSKSVVLRMWSLDQQC